MCVVSILLCFVSFFWFLVEVDQIESIFVVSLLYACNNAIICSLSV